MMETYVMWVCLNAFQSLLAGMVDWIRYLTKEY